jgi:hypothetical protein
VQDVQTPSNTGEQSYQQKENQDPLQPESMSQSEKVCANCKTERYGVYCRGYCQHCYRLTIQRQQIERWDPRRYWHALHPEEVQRSVVQNRPDFDAQSRQDRL